LLTPEREGPCNKSGANDLRDFGYPLFYSNVADALGGISADPHFVASWGSSDNATSKP
jgi:hypothetical protein